MEVKKFMEVKYSLLVANEYQVVGVVGRCPRIAEELHSSSSKADHFVGYPEHPLTQVRLKCRQSRGMCHGLIFRASSCG